MRTLSERVVDVVPRLSRGRLTILALASLLAPSVMMIQHLRDETEDLPVLIGAAGVLFLLVVMRIAGLVRKQEQSAIRERALRGAGTALVTATNREGIYEATLQAARSIAGESSVIRVLVAEEALDDFTGRGRRRRDGEVIGRTISLSIHPGLEARPAPVAPLVRGPDPRRPSWRSRSGSPRRAPSS